MGLRDGRQRHPGARRNPHAPPLRLPAPQAALRPLHAGQGVRNHRYAQGRPPEGLRSLLRHRQARQGRNHHVRDGLDAEERGRAEHPRHVHRAASARQHRRGRRRRQRAARRIQRAGLHRPGAPRGHLARLSARAGLHAADPRGLQRHHAQDQRSQERELVGQPAQIHGELPHVALPRRDARDGLRLRPAPRRRQEEDRLHVDVHLRPHGRGQARRPVRVGHEPRLLRPERQQEPQGDGKPQVAGQRQPVRQRNRLLLARPRQGPRLHRHGSLLPALLHVH